MTRRHAAVVAFGLFLAWTVATYVLEGRIHTLLRPDAALDRAVYVFVANLAIGTGGALYLVRRLHAAGALALRRVGFRSAGHSSIAVIVGIASGSAAYALQSPPTMDPIVILNGFAQVLGVSVAEVLVCWVLVGGTVEAALRPRGRPVSVGLAIATASVLFGVYHFAHSPPFDTLAMVVLLAVVGVATGLFFFLSRNVYGTIAFHNFLGVLGVLRALDRAGELESYAVPRVPLLLTGLVAAGLLVSLHALWLSSDDGGAVASGAGSGP